MDGFLGQFEMDSIKEYGNLPYGFSRGNLTKKINTINPYKKQSCIITPPPSPQVLSSKMFSTIEDCDLDAIPLIDTDFIINFFEEHCKNIGIYNGLIVHALPKLIPDIENYPQLRSKFESDLRSNTPLKIFTLPYEFGNPFDLNRKHLATRFCQCMKDYFRNR